MKYNTKQWLENVILLKGSDPWQMRELPPELRSTQKIIRAHNAGLVAQKKGKTPNGRRMWKVVL